MLPPLLPDEVEDEGLACLMRSCTRMGRVQAYREAIRLLERQQDLLMRLIEAEGDFDMDAIPKRRFDG